MLNIGNCMDCDVIGNNCIKRPQVPHCPQKTKTKNNNNNKQTFKQWKPGGTNKQKQVSLCSI